MVQSAAHFSVSSVARIRLSTTLPVHSQDSGVHTSPQNRYFPSRPRKSPEHRSKTIHHVQDAVKAAAVCEQAAACEHTAACAANHSDTRTVQRCMLGTSVLSEDQQEYVTLNNENCRVSESRTGSLTRCSSSLMYSVYLYNIIITIVTHLIKFNRKIIMAEFHLALSLSLSVQHSTSIFEIVAPFSTRIHTNISMFELFLD